MNSSFLNTSTTDRFLNTSTPARLVNTSTPARFVNTVKSYERDIDPSSLPSGREPCN